MSAMPQPMPASERLPADGNLGSLAAVLARGGEPGARPAARDRLGAIGFDVLAARVVRMADLLREQRVARLAIALDNSIDWAVLDLAAQQARVPVIPLPPFFSSAQVEHVLADSGADAIVADRTGARWLAALPVDAVLELSPSVGLHRIDRAAPRADLPQDTAKISYTSGTTGQPKGVCLSQTVLDRVAHSLCLATQERGIERHLCLLPLATLLENVAGLYAPWIAGAEVVLPSLAETGLLGAAGLDVARLIDCIGEHEPGSIILLPQMFAAIVDAVENGARLPLSLQFAAVGGGVVGASLLERAERLGIPAFEGYGLTECGSVVALNTPHGRRIGSVGRPLAHCRVRIGGDGEVHVGGAVMAGYLGEPASEHAEIATGDIGRIDGDGYLHIDGRRKNVLITSYGRNLSPEWVEAALTASGSIAQAALFGDGRPFNVAVIVPRPGASLADLEREIGRVNRTLPDYAQVRHWLLADGAFTPGNGLATANGRIRRAEIERHYLNRIEACYEGALESYA